MRIDELTAALVELGALEGRRRAGTITAAEHLRSLELCEAIVAVGVVLKATVEAKPEGPPPPGCHRGRDGIIRSAPGVFEERFARALAATATAPIRIRPRVTPKGGRRSRATRARTHPSHGPPRPSDDPDRPSRTRERS